MIRRFLPLIVFGYIALSFALNPQSPIHTHHLSDPDDFMRLHQVANWLQGQGWYDLSVPRLSPDAHAVVHWSRFIDLPIALIAWPFLSFWGVKGALLTAAFLTPLLWLTAMLVLLPAIARSMLDDKTAPWTSVFLLFAPFLLFDLSPGRVDHHGAQAVMAATAFLGLSRILRGDKSHVAAIGTALSVAVGFWIGPESLVWVILLIVALGVSAAWLGGQVARAAALFGLCLPIAVTAALFVALPDPTWSDRALSWFSPAYVLFATLAGAALILGWLGNRKLPQPAVRLAIYAGLASLAAVAFFTLVPAAQSGPFADYHKFNATLGLDAINEAQPLARAMHFDLSRPITVTTALLVFLKLLALPLTALIGSLWAARATTAMPHRLWWLAQSMFIAATLTLALFWQLRVAFFSQLFMLVPLAFVFEQGRAALARPFKNRALFWSEIALFLAMGPLPVVLLPAFNGGKPVFPDIAFYPAVRPAAANDIEPVILALIDPDGLGAKSHRFLNIGDDGPQLLFRTRHSVLSGNYDAPGNVDAFAFFSAKTDAEARDAAQKSRADYVLISHSVPLLYLGKDYYALDRTTLQAGVDGKLRLVNTDPQQPLIQRLIHGQAPGWLKPIEIPGSSDYLLFEIMTQTMDIKK